MSRVGEREKVTQREVVCFFRDALDYAYLGRWQEREENSHIEQSLLTDWLRRRGVEEKLITRALHRLDKAAALGGSKSLYDANREVYGLLRYGLKVKPSVGEQTETVWLIDWKNPENNDFALAEEVTVRGVHTKRPDVVLYVNGIALGVLELKRSTVSVTRGHPPESGQPKEGIYRAVLYHRAASDGRQRHRGPALRGYPDAREVLAAVEGGGQRRWAIQRFARR